MCALSPSNEWSGVLFYTYTGKFEDNSLELTARDFFLMDLGEHAHTIFDFDAPEITQYMYLNKLMDCSMGLIHSHCDFNAFFSGEDEDTLLTQGENMHNFLSLIVNDAGQYVARITRQLHEKGEIHISYNGVVTSPFFKEEDCVVGTEHEENSKEYTKSNVSYFELNIVKEEVFSDSLNDRFGQLYKAPLSSSFKKEINWDFEGDSNDSTLPFENPTYPNVYGGYGFYGQQTKDYGKKESTKEPKKETKANPTNKELDWIKLILIGGPVGKVLAEEHPVYTKIYDKAFKTRQDFINWAQNSISFNSDILTAEEFDCYGRKFNTYIEQYSDEVLSRKYKNFWKDAANEIF